MLRPEKVQTVLSLLAQIRGFHIIASIDHINAPLSKSLFIIHFEWLQVGMVFYQRYIVSAVRVSVVTPVSTA